MAAPWRWLAFISVPIIFVVISTTVSNYVGREVRVKLLRLNFVVSVEFLLFAGSIFIWKQLVSKISSTYQNNSLKHSGENGKPEDEDNISGNFLHQLWRAAVLLFLCLTQLSYFLGMIFVQADPLWFVYLSFCCLGAFIILISVLVAMVILESVVLAIQRCRRDQTRRLRINPYIRALLVTGLVTVLSLMGVSRANEGPFIKSVEIPIHKLPPSMDGFKITQLSDIHLGPTVGKSKLEKAVDIGKDWNPDMVVITGDLVDSTVDKLREAVEPLRALHAEYGAYFITGNHEYYTGNVDGWFQHLKTLGVESLHNQHVKIVNKEKPDDWFYLAGTDDLHADRIGYTGHGMNLDKALANTDENHAVVLLAHQPKAAKRALQSEYNISLILSGHTHSGQILPLIIGAYISNPFFAGLYQYSEHTYVYVSSGTYYWGFPMRLATTPEVTYITLRAA